MKFNKQAASEATLSMIVIIILAIMMFLAFIMFLNKNGLIMN
jgi:hypothetical protein